uniref:DNA topoisomerase I n=1 Tax=Panagrellus redivivus TaxID=6233 RepID=A0A7E4UPT1_PANRE
MAAVASPIAGSNGLGNGHVKEEINDSYNNNNGADDEEMEDVKPVVNGRRSKGAKRKHASSDDEDYSGGDSEDEYKPTKKTSKKDSKKSPKKESKKKESKAKVKKEPKTPTKSPKAEPASPTKAGGRKKKAEEEEEIWKWWEEDKKPDGVKWNSLHHNGPLFAPAYDPLPKSVKFKYNGEVMHLSEPTEEVASFYGRMLDHDYTTKDTFNTNFFKDWRKVMTKEEKEKITDLSKCDFKQIHAHFLAESEKRKAKTKEEKLKDKAEREEEQKQYGTAIVDGHKQKIANFRTEPPGLFRGRGDHPKMGCLKKRVQPEDVIINCSKEGDIPKPPPGHKWKEVRHDNTVSWLCSWTENVLGQNKYVMLNPSSKLKGEKDFEKFERARELGKIIDNIRIRYNEEMGSKEMRARQRAVALYFIDKLALRAGNEKDTDEAADTVGCCSLRCEHIKLHKEFEGKKYVVEFDFLGKDSIRYFNRISVDKKVFKNLGKFMENKEPGDDLFDRLDTASLNDHLKKIMPGLTAKCFRTYNASFTLQQQLDKLTNKNDTVHEKMLSYNRANRQVAILCNHQRAVPKTHEKSMENLKNKIKDKKKELKEAKEELDKTRSVKEKEKIEKKITRVKDQIKRLKTQKTDKDENKQIALGTSKLNYLDPRISVAWCRKYDVPIEKIYNKTQREKFRWAIDMIQDGDYKF